MSFSPYLSFTREAWCAFRKNMPLVLDERDLEKLQGVNEKVSLLEVEEVYLPLSRLLSLYVQARQSLHRTTSEFLGEKAPKVPFVIGVAGSVAVGKSTSSRILQALLSRWPHHPKVALVTTDGFLFSNDELTKRSLLDKKGFPESFDIRRLLQFLAALKSGESPLFAPVYSHHHYDIVPGEFIEVNNVDIVIVEGLNILQTSADAQVFVSDFLDFSIFVDAEMCAIRKWFIDRVLQFKNTSFKDPKAYFHAITAMTDQETIQFCEDIWQRINERNLLENILPFKNRAQLILYKGLNHEIQKVFLRKL